MFKGTKTCTNRTKPVRAFFALLVLVILAPPAWGQSRIKDIANFEGIRDNILVGYGLVVGLNGTGDNLGDAVFTRESLIGMLQRLGVNARNDNLDSKNVAAVMVTANMPPFARQGSRIDISVSAIGSAKSLQGGTLVVTPLLGADGEVYAVSQGSVAISGFSVQGNAEKVTRGIPTVGRIANGAIIEREIDFSLRDLDSIDIALKNPDLTTAGRMAKTINTFLGATAAQSLDPGTVNLAIPASYNGNAVALMTDIENLLVRPDNPAKVVIDEGSGVIVIGKDVRINEVAIAQGNLTVRITETPQVSQPNAFATAGQTQVVNRTNITVNDDADKKLALVPEAVTLEEVVDGLNALGIGPRDMITILQSIKAAGALQADIEVM